MMIAVHHDISLKEIRFCVRGGKTYGRVEFVARDLLVRQTDRLLRI